MGSQDASARRGSRGAFKVRSSTSQNRRGLAEDVGVSIATRSASVGLATAILITEDARACIRHQRDDGWSIQTRDRESSAHVLGILAVLVRESSRR
jgi:hypothetical protein